MSARGLLRTAGTGVAAAAAAAAAGYAALVVLHRARYGAPKVNGGRADSLLDQFLPNPEVLEHHHIDIEAAPRVVLSAARDMELLGSPVIRAIIRAREIALGGEADPRPHPTKLVEQMQSIGWVMLAETPDREIVMGAVTQPWLAAPVFRSIPPDQFLAFNEPDYVKIVWTLRVEPLDDLRTRFHTETRVATTNQAAHDRFRQYWSFVAPGVQLIRVAMLRPLKREAEARARATA